ncbi:MAG: alpha/beta fold hydrolase [Anaeromyxobacteraceae bacterium]
MTDYAPARWLPGAHTMTVYASVARPFPRPPQVRERWELPDGDFLDVDRTPGDGPDAPVLVVLHGLEGSSRAPYVRGLVAVARARGLAAVAVNFRGCSGEENRHARFYHSGETGDVGHVVARLAAERPGRPLLLAGFSLGGNVTAKYLGERGDDLPAELGAAVAISPPLDLSRCARALDAPGFWNLVYRERFLRRLRGKALAKAPRFPEIFDVPAIRAARTFSDFDGVVTARIHGYASAEDYWQRCSSGRFLAGVRRPLLAICAEDDPIAPVDARSVEAARANPAVTLEVTPAGGHVGFVSGFPFWPSFWAERRAVEFLARHAGR